MVKFIGNIWVYYFWVFVLGKDLEVYCSDILIWCVNLGVVILVKFEGCEVVDIIVDGVLDLVFCNVVFFFDVEIDVVDMLFSLEVGWSSNVDFGGRWWW